MPVASQEKNVKHTGSITLSDVIEIARVMRHRSCAKDLAGTCKEILGTAVSVGCKCDGKHPSAIMEAVSAARGVCQEQRACLCLPVCMPLAHFASQLALPCTTAALLSHHPSLHHANMPYWCLFGALLYRMLHREDTIATPSIPGCPACMCISDVFCIPLLHVQIDNGEVEIPVA